MAQLTAPFSPDLLPAVPAQEPCQHEDHDAITRDRSRWDAATINARPWAPYGFLVADCTACGSTLVAKYPGSGYRAIGTVGKLTPRRSQGGEGGPSGAPALLYLPLPAPPDLPAEDLAVRL